jgi:hypothetical protein
MLFEQGDIQAGLRHSVRSVQTSRAAADDRDVVHQ